jgi:hypothetical protein
MATRIPTASRNAAVNGVVDQLDAAAGTVEIRTGSQPASANDAATGTLLATLTLPAPAFGAGSTGVATANSISTVQGVADGTAGWFRCKTNGGATVIDGSVSTSGADMNLNTTTISTGVDVTVSSWTITMPAG